MRAIDAVVNIWTAEALAHRPDWKDGFFAGKVKSRSPMSAVSLERMLERMDEARIERAFLVAARSGRLGLPGSYHMPYEVVARACEQHPGRLYGLAGVDPTLGMSGLRAFEDAVHNMGFIGAHAYPHWFELAPDHARWYPYYAKACELGVPFMTQVGQSLIYSPDQRLRSVGRPIALDAVACDFPELRLIGIHVGIPWHDEMIAMAWKHDNVCICADAHSPKYWPESFVKYLASYGQDKVLFGTDYPVLDFRRTRDEVEALGLEPEVLQKLLRDNALRVYGLA
ncbi:MAG TPA: amidohydrolase family protein [Steroidobacteraceae bacterium]|nr:amidohydrolase family protein [Steroidobacteraceae bacterium]